jgi:catechol 2,3-dioxygenase-like lactoylglutathione lyase family enzyme
MTGESQSLAGLSAIQALDYTVVRVRDFRFVENPTLGAGIAAVQLAFRVPYEEVDVCAAELTAAGISLLSPPTDQPWRHRTLFFCDPDGNLIEIYADF